jgi:oxygen-independent coproporphyrinogen-3 oxidase
LNSQLSISNKAEITLEANPGTWDKANFQGFYEAGINRLSIGVQSFNNRHLETLGRIHNSDMAIATFNSARKAGFDNINIDLMHSLPQQDINQALDDLRQAIDLGSEHLSWYQLTIEPNTAFYKNPPVQPNDEQQWEIINQGQALLAEAGFQQYEVSAYAKFGQESKHNLNYWGFGDYLGIGAGAHGKLTANGKIVRTQKTRMPNDYLSCDNQFSNQAEVLETDLPFEFMLNACRLIEGFPIREFGERTLLDERVLNAQLQKLVELELIEETAWRTRNYFCPTNKGRLFVNDIVSTFMND